MDWIAIILIAVIFFGIILLIIDTKKDITKRELIDKKYNVSKFPVTSLMGNQYYAEIIYNHREYSIDNFKVKIYTRNFKKNGKSKDKIIADRGVEFENSNLDYDYIKVVGMAIGEYEAEHKAEFLKKKHEVETVAANKKLFEAWDGIIKEEED